MLIHERAMAEGKERESTEVRIRLPARLHILLMSCKVLTGRSMSGIVAEALERYLQEEIRSRRLRVSTHDVETEIPA